MPGAVSALSAAIGLLVGLRSIVRVEIPSLRPLLTVSEVPIETLGIGWSERALWPADLQAAGLERLLAVVAAVILGAALVATLNALVLLAESASSRRGELAVRGALGASPATLALGLAREVRTLLLAGTGMGLLLGLGAGGAARALWPDALAPLALSRADDVALVIGFLLGLLTYVHVRSALRGTIGARGAALLRSGRRVSADPMEVFARKALTAGHTAVAATLLVASVVLSGTGAPTGRGAAEDGREVVALDVTAPRGGGWGALLQQIGEVPGMAAESLATPGALLGLGIREIAVAECGPCIRGQFPAPLWSVVADHHSVGPGWLELAGLEVVSGRGFRAEDGPGAEPVAVVNRTFARTAFYHGDPIGRGVHVGTDFGRVYTVVGVVADARTPGLGSDELPREAVYLNALQAEPTSATLLLRGSDEAIAEAEALLATEGFEPGSPKTLAEERARGRRALAWTYRLAVVVALLGLLLAAHGVYAAALQTTRRRTPDLAIRRSVGADARDIVRYVLGERLRVVAWGLAGFAFLGTLLVALLQRATGLPAASVTDYASVALLLALVGTLASLRAAREASVVDPAVLLE